MSTKYEKRVQALEATALPKDWITRIIYHIIAPDRSLAGFVARDIECNSLRDFDHLPGESDEALEARVYAEMGWPADEEQTP